MSKRVPVTIQCPRCHHKQNAVLFRSIWVEEPDNLALILNDQINVYRCDRCGHEERLEYPFLATNVKKGVAVWYEPYHDPQIDADIAQYRAHLGPNSYYAKALRIADWHEFKCTLLRMNNAGPTPGREPVYSTALKGKFRGFLDHIRARQHGPQAVPDKRHFAAEAIAAYGELLERYPTAIIDSAMLPVSKTNMKILLKSLYAATQSPEQKNFFEVGFIFLSNFQDGVGPHPIATPPPPKDIRAMSTADKTNFEKWRGWHNLSVAEMEVLNAEWQRFKNGEPI